jgi:eukaryotic-like serine/threonine-protein kinase
VTAPAAQTRSTPERLVRPAAAIQTGLSGQLSPELEADAARRLGALALAISAVAAVMETLELAHRPRAALAMALRIGLVGLSVLAALALHLAVSRWKVNPARARDLGTVFQVANGLVLSVLFHAATLTAGVEVHGWSPVAVWIFIYPLIVPTAPRRVALASVGTALMEPLGVWVNILAGAANPGALALIQQFAPTLMACALAPVAADICYGLTMEVKRAREMGAYRLVERLGQGGMGEVWRAQHRLLARPAAVKLIRPGSLGSDPSYALELARRFEREAQATATLRSPHTIVVYDYGVAADGTFHYVMELLDGYSLQTLVARFGPVPPERAVHMLIQICHSLAEAHAAGMVHRDIKPANLFTCRLGLDVDFVKVLDFGLVKTERPRRHGVEDLTKDGAFTGTPGFMPPEVALGNQPIDGRADLYALGCVAYWLLTGKKVFEGGNAMQMVIDHVRTRPSPVSHRTDQPIPAELERIVMRCLEKDPAARPASARQLALDLAAIGMTEAWTEERARRWWLEHPPASRDLDDQDTETQVSAVLAGTTRSLAGSDSRDASADLA